MKFKKNKMSLNNVLSKTKSGDLLLFRSKKSCLFTNIVTPFTHIAMIIKMPNMNKIKVLEIHQSCFILDYKTEDVNLYDINYRIETYNGDIFILFINNEIPTKQISQLLQNKEIMNAKFDNNFIINYIKYNLLKSKTIKKNLACTYFISNILQDLNIIEKSSINIYPTAADFLHLKTIYNYKYSSPIYIQTS
jgi:hypothetical protein